MKPRSAQQLMEQNKIVKHYAGSHAYGTALPTSDTDLRGIFVADPVNIRTPFFPVREADDSNEEDTKLFELTHFMKLCVDCNPNIIETLWVDDQDITFRTPAYDHIRQHRDKLLSTKIAYTTSGYATSQLRRIKNHGKWITWQEPLTELYDLLAKAFANGDVDKSFIEQECGNDILAFMENQGYFNKY